MLRVFFRGKCTRTYIRQKRSTSMSVFQGHGFTCILSSFRPNTDTRCSACIHVLAQDVQRQRHRPIGSFERRFPLSLLPRPLCDRQSLRPIRIFASVATDIEQRFPPFSHFPLLPTTAGNGNGGNVWKFARTIEGSKRYRLLWKFQSCALWSGSSFTFFLFLSTCTITLEKCLERYKNWD